MPPTRKQARLVPGPAQEHHRPGVGVRDPPGVDVVAPSGVLDHLVGDLDCRLSRIKNVLRTPRPELHPQLVVLSVAPRAVQRPHSTSTPASAIRYPFVRHALAIASRKKYPLRRATHDPP